MIWNSGTGRQQLDGSATPWWLFDLLNMQVRKLTGHEFEIDATACDWNSKCDLYWDEATDSLQQDWSEYRTLFYNPPFSATLIGLFVENAFQAGEQGSTITLLIPLWPGYEWFQSIKQRAVMQDVVGTVTFSNGDGSKTVLNNGKRSMGIVVATLGPKIVAGTNGPPIRRSGIESKLATQARSNGKAAAARRS